MSRRVRKTKKARRAKAIKRILLTAFMVLGIFKGVGFLIGELSYLKKIIVIDAGHGGKDPGTIGFRGSYEKDINLQVTQKLEKGLKDKGYRVVLTRDNDVYVDNMERAALANKKRAKVFISIHGNALENNHATNGIQVLYHPNRESSVRDLDNKGLAEIVMDTLLKTTGAANRGVIEREDLIVLNQAQMPAIIIECGFLSNENEEALLQTDAYQQKIVDGVVEALEICLQ